MAESAVSIVVTDESASAALAGQVALSWLRVCGEQALTVGLSGPLGAGKTAWVRSMLRGLGYRGRVPSPTYTLMEIYEISDISLIHLDFYRIAEARDLEFLGLRDWQGRARTWVIAEWPEQVAGWLDHCDIAMNIAVTGATERRLSWEPRTELGRRCAAAIPPGLPRATALIE